MFVKRIGLLPFAVVFASLAVACGSLETATLETSLAGTVTPAPRTATESSSPSQPNPAPTVSPAPTNVRVQDPNEYPFAPLLPFDGIPPVYNPKFASAAEAPLHDDELVIGITLGDEAKAYPITVLRSREMVNDELAGIPILVTW